MTTPFENEADFLAHISSVQGNLTSFAETSEAQIYCVARAFKNLAGHADAILTRAASIVKDADANSLGSALTSLRAHCLQSRAFQEERLSAATTVLDTIQIEAELLRQITIISQRQESIASHLKSLSMLTNIEAIHIGSAESEFKLLARELAEFSSSLLHQTVQLVTSTEKHKHAVDETCAILSLELPHLKIEIKRMEEELTAALELIDNNRMQLSAIPEQFSRGVRDTAGQIAGVIAAVQAQDITRQQIEHVQQSLEIVVSKLRAIDVNSASPWPFAYAALRVQAGQIKMIREIVADWIAQIGHCMAGIHSLSAAELASIGPELLAQWRELSKQLLAFESLQHKTQIYGHRIQCSLTGLAALRNLVNTHIEESRRIRERLRLLTFNSLIEASQIGERGAGLCAIAKLIKDLAVGWSCVTQEFNSSLDKITGILGSVRQATGAFTETISNAKCDAELQVQTSLQHVNRTAIGVDGASKDMQEITRKMHAEVASFGTIQTHLNSSLTQLDTALRQVEAIICRLEKYDPQIMSHYEPAEIERVFSSLYTTESETRVMNAVLRGETLVDSKHSLAGNSVELF